MSQELTVEEQALIKEVELANLAAAFREVVEAKLKSDRDLQVAFDGATTAEDRQTIAQQQINVEMIAAVVQVTMVFGPKEDLNDALTSLVPASLAYADAMARVASRVMDNDELTALMPRAARQAGMREKFMSHGAANLAKLCRPR